MTDHTRRQLILRSAQTAALFLAGCQPTATAIINSGTDDSGHSGSGTSDSGTPSGHSDSGNGDSGHSDTGVSDCPEADGALLELIPFIGETDREIGVLVDDGLDGRLVHDISAIDEDTLITPTEDFFIRTAAPTLPSGTWTIRIRGLVETEADLTLEDLPAAEDIGVVMMECSGNTSYGGFGLLSAATWRGVPMSAVLDSIKMLPAGTRVKVSGVDDHPPAAGSSIAGAAWVFTSRQLQDAILAIEMNGEPLTEDRGAPIRLLVPGWYGCVCIKWVDEIEIVDDDEPATSQMQEFATRTHQTGTPALARDYIAASMDLSAVPVRVEKWRIDGAIRYRVVGIVWGGSATDGPLMIGFDDEDYAEVEVCPARPGDWTWALWSYWWTPSQIGRTILTMKIDDASVQTHRLDSGWYWRTVDIDEV